MDEAQRALIIFRELDSIRNEVINMAGITFVPDLNDICHMTAYFQGPDRSPYEGGINKVDIQIPEEYPFAVSCMRFITKIWMKLVMLNPKKLLFEKGDFGSGWKRFVIDHKLREGDALVFRLIEQWKLKIYIVIKVDGPNEINMSPNEMNADPRQPESSLRTLDRTDNINQEHVQDQSLVVYDQPRDEHVDADAPEGLRFAQSVLEFQEIKSIDDFNIVVDGLVIDSKIPENFILKYYDLCKSQNAYMHENLLKGLNAKATAGIILKTVTIAVKSILLVMTSTHEIKPSNELLEAKKNALAKAGEKEKTLSKRRCAVRGVIENLDHGIEALKRNGENLEASV